MELRSLIERASDARALTIDESRFAFERIMAGEASPVQISALLASLRTKGHTPAEVAGGVQALRGAMVPVPASDPDGLVDTCGTGGGEVTTFNVSTAAALVAAGAGARVAKHGNRSFTSKCGSADVLETLGVVIELTPAAMGRVLERVGVVFMFAPLLHPAMRHVAPVRRELGISTIMNLLGPLTNPAGVRRQVVGVADGDLLPLVVRALEVLGHERALVVHGAAGMDEISPFGPTLVAELRDGEVREYRIDPEGLGLPPAAPEEIAGGTPQQNAETLRRVLAGEDRGGARTVTLLNAAAALHVAGLAEGFRDGVERAAEAVDSGASARVLDELRSASLEEGERTRGEPAAR